SPEADTPSYWPERISVTISSEVLPTLLLTLQPVSFSKSDTQSTFGSVEPSSTYPAQEMMLTWPSPAPSWASLSIFGTEMPPGPLPLSSPPPQPASTSTPAASTAVRTRPL